MENLSLKATAIGSLPHNNPQEALALIFENFKEIPFWPQLAGVHRYEDMVIQCNQGIPGITYCEKNEKHYCDMQSEEFYTALEEFFMDYESIVGEKDLTNLEKYAITEPFSCAIKPFCEKLHGFKFAKGHVVGPFTWGTSLCDEEGKCSFYDDTYREVLIKAIALKALWQIEKFKKANQNITPIIFLDEPVLSQYGTSAFVTIQKKDIIEALSEIAKVIKDFGGLCAVHCCGKADWSLLIEAGIDIINVDGYSYAKSLAIYADKVKEFLSKGGYIAWGMIPTLDKEALAKITKADIDSLEEKFEQAVSYLSEKGIDKDLIIKQSFITPACGAGSLSVELAKKAMSLTLALSERLKIKYTKGA